MWSTSPAVQYTMGKSEGEDFNQLWPEWWVPLKNIYDKVPKSLLECTIMLHSPALAKEKVWHLIGIMLVAITTTTLQKYLTFLEAPGTQGWCLSVYDLFLSNFLVSLPTYQPCIKLLTNQPVNRPQLPWQAGLVKLSLHEICIKNLVKKNPRSLMKDWCLCLTSKIFTRIRKQKIHLKVFDLIYSFKGI